MPKPIRPVATGSVAKNDGRSLTPFWETSDGESVRLYRGNAGEVLKRLPARSVHCVVTSPPYWGLRDYKAGVEEIGREETPGEYVARMVEVCAEIHRVLRDDGTFWLNLGDTYSGAAGHRNGLTNSTLGGSRTYGRGADSERRKRDEELKSGNLVGIPWRVALALQDDGWVLRQDVIWAKPSPMPESVRNRCTKAHEYVFLLTKGTDYYYDAEAIKVDAEPAERVISGKSGSYGQAIAAGVKPSGNGIPGSRMRTGNKANKRSVWTVSPQGYPGAHYATFPPKIIEPMILAGTSAKGCCSLCGRPWGRVVEEVKLRRDRPNEYVKRTGEEGTGNSCGNSVAGVETRTKGWYPECSCRGAEVVPCTVLDPFIGSGTTAVVSIEHGRRCIGIDLSEKYLRENAIPRIGGVLSNRIATRTLVPGREVKVVPLGLGVDGEEG